MNPRLFFGLYVSLSRIGQLTDGCDMARKRRNLRANRETHDFASLEELASPKPKKNQPSQLFIYERAPKRLAPIEDRRTYHPAGKQRPARAVQKANHRLVAPSLRSTKKTHPRASVPREIAFHAPKSVLTCLRRSIRRQVVFALKKTGKGARTKKHRWSEYSGIKC